MAFCVATFGWYSTRVGDIAVLVRLSYLRTFSFIAAQYAGVIVREGDPMLRREYWAINFVSSGCCPRSRMLFSSTSVNDLYRLGEELNVCVCRGLELMTLIEF